MNSNTITWDQIKNNPDAIKVLDHGFVYLKSVYGTDITVAESARISYGQGTKKLSDDRNLIRYLLRHNHTSPFEQIEATFIFKLPLFVMGQLVRHRTANINQYSGRYSEMPEEYYIPNEWRLQSRTNKQGSEDTIQYDPLTFDRNMAKFNQNTAEEAAQQEYSNRLKSGISRELARTVLPQSQYTLCVWKCDVHNIMHFLKLRLDPHAQYEMRVYAEAMFNLLKPKFPIVIEAFEDYKLHSISYSRLEHSYLNFLMKSNSDEKYLTLSNMMKEELSVREISEFLNKLPENIRNELKVFFGKSLI